MEAGDQTLSTLWVLAVACVTKKPFPTPPHPPTPLVFHRKHNLLHLSLKSSGAVIGVVSIPRHAQMFTDRMQTGFGFFGSWLFFQLSLWNVSVIPHASIPGGTLCVLGLQIAFVCKCDNESWQKKLWLLKWPVGLCSHELFQWWFSTRKDTPVALNVPKAFLPSHYLFEEYSHKWITVGVTSSKP